MGNQLGESGRRFTCVGMEVKAKLAVGAGAVSG